MAEPQLPAERVDVAPGYWESGSLSFIDLKTLDAAQPAG